MIYRLSYTIHSFIHSSHIYILFRCNYFLFNDYHIIIIIIIIINNIVDIICLPANAGTLGTLCSAIRFTDLAPSLDLGVAIPIIPVTDAVAVVVLPGKRRRELKDGDQEQERKLQRFDIIGNRLPLVKQYTVFGPTNAAFNKLKKVDRDFLFSGKGKDTLRDIVEYHLIENRRISYQELVCGSSYSMMDGDHFFWLFTSFFFVRYTSTGIKLSSVG